MNEVVFTTYSFGDLYVRQQQRLKESILSIYPNANLRFWKDESGESYPQEGRPPGAKTFKESMYGFKVHCIKNCLNEGFKKIIFLDAAMVLESKIDRVMELASELGVLCAIDRSSLKDRCSDRALNYRGKSRKEIEDLTIVGGSLYVFDFNNPITESVFNMWSYMESAGMFGSEYEAANGLIQGHRNDEACMALCLDAFGLKPLGFDEVGYHNLGNTRKGSEVFVFHKLHFKSIGVVEEHSVDESLLPIHANILDLGCRGFQFTNKLRELEHKVYPVDIGEFEGDYYRYAIAHKDGSCGVSNERDPDATHIIEGNEIPMMTIESFGKLVKVDKWDLIKMDIEGEEYNILKESKHPMAPQVSVEFHAHCVQSQTKGVLDNLLDWLSTWYYIHNRVWEEKHSCHANYWDILLIAK